MSEVAVAGLSRRSVVSPRRQTSSALRTARSSAEVVDGSDAYERLQRRMAAAGSTQPATPLFQTPELLAAWARHFADTRNGSRRSSSATAARPVLIWPLWSSGAILSAWRAAPARPVGQYDEMLIDPDIDAEARRSTPRFDALKSRKRPDLLRA